MKTVADLIAQAKQKTSQEFPEAAVADLRKILAHNDASGRNERVSAAQAMELLATVHGQVMGRQRFDKIVKRHLGRGWGV